MGIVFVLIPVTLILVGLSCWAFFWAVGSGQFDELDTPGWEILLDEDSKGEPPK
jgi:cbb3-type cytochrome oxidase maturation protein